MGVPGWKRLTSRAVVPLWLTVMMASAPISCAVVQAAWAVAAATERRPRPLDCMAMRFAWLMSASVRRAMAFMVFTVSTGYLPAAVSPESIMAEVPS